MNPPFASVRELLHAKLEALPTEFDNIANHAAYGETINDLARILSKQNSVSTANTHSL